MGNLRPIAKKTWLCSEPTLTASSITNALLTKPYSTTSPNAQPSMTLTPPSQVDAAINKLKNQKSPGLNVISLKAYKAMNTETRRQVHEYVAAFFKGDVDYNGWHESQCVPVPKLGNLSNPNKWCGIMLMDVCSKIFSLVVNGRAFRFLELHGTHFQFGGTSTLGCQDGLFTLKTLLNAHKNHNLPSLVAFVDLVKAYDTANHDLLLKVLEKYGAPPSWLLPSRPCTLI
jgi:hypothetical protein